MGIVIPFLLARQDVCIAGCFKMKSGNVIVISSSKNERAGEGVDRSVRIAQWLGARLQSQENLG